MSRRTLSETAARLAAWWLLVSIVVLVVGGLVVSVFSSLTQQPTDWALFTVIALWFEVGFVNLLVAIFMYHHAEAYGRIGVRWAVAFFLFGSPLAGVVYLLTWPAGRASESQAPPIPSGPKSRALLCSKCGASMRRGDLFCRRCGADDVETNVSARRRDPDAFCAECGKRVGQGDLFCPGCGRKLVRKRANSDTQHQPDHEQFRGRSNYVGDAKHYLYHLTECKSVRLIDGKDKRDFATAEAARKARYLACEACNPDKIRT